MKWTFNALFRLTVLTSTYCKVLSFFFFHAWLSPLMWCSLLYGCLPPLTFWTHDDALTENIRKMNAKSHLAITVQLVSAAINTQKVAIKGSVSFKPNKIKKRCAALEKSRKSLQGQFWVYLWLVTCNNRMMMFSGFMQIFLLGSLWVISLCGRAHKNTHGWSLFYFIFVEPFFFFRISD